MTPLPEFFISYPWWTVLIIIAVALIYAGVLYIKNPLNKLNNTVSTFLFVLRFIVVTILLLLLLSPVIKTKKKQLEKPIVILGIDNSQSILLVDDSLYYTDTLVNKIDNLRQKLLKNNTVDTYLFGNNVTESENPDFTDNISNYSDFFNMVKQNYTGLNVAAVILFGDGIINSGIDAASAASNISFPVFTVALGDTIQAKDAKIESVRYNSIAYTGDIFPMEINIEAHMLKGTKAKLKLLDNNSLIVSKSIIINSDDYRSTIDFNLKAKKAGKHRFTVLLESNSNEISKTNNTKNIFVDFIDSRQKILILAYAPHPDVGAIKQSLLRNKNYSVKVSYISNFTGDVGDYDLVILHQIPAIKNSGTKILKQLNKLKIPTLFVLAKNSNLPMFNKYFKGLNIISSVGSHVAAQFSFNNSFNYFTIDKEQLQQLSTMPPLSVPLANYKITNNIGIFGWQRVNDITTDFPLILYFNNTKSGVITGEGLFLWRMHDFKKYGNFNAFDDFINKSAMFLIADTDKRHFKVKTEGDYDGYEDIMLNAELYNAAMESVTTPDVSLTLTNEAGEKFQYVFSPYENNYQLNLKKLPIGIYRYYASTTLGDDNFNDSGEFVVKKNELESQNLVANHRLLYEIALSHDGNMYYPKDVNRLFKDITNLDNNKPIIHYEDKFTNINSLIYIMIGIILLLSLEWFLRKYFGNY